MPPGSTKHTVKAESLLRLSLHISNGIGYSNHTHFIQLRLYICFFHQLCEIGLDVELKIGLDEKMRTLDM